MAKPKLLIHGGAGTLRKADLTPQQETDFHNAMSEALIAGYEVLADGDNSLNAVSAAIQVLEDAPLFNAGYGSVITRAGTIELDAAIMDGNTLKAGSVAGLSRIRNPIMLAQKILEESEHVMLIGAQAEDFAQTLRIDLIESDQLITAHQLSKWHDFQKNPTPAKSAYEKYGTVGAVALDARGKLAAGTSTGGMMDKLPGRVGDSPIIGAGTYANKTCAVSTTGHGEYFMRLVLAYDIAAQMRYKHVTLKQAVVRAITELTRLGGTGGVIALDRQGNFGTAFNTEGMYRGYIDADHILTKIY